MIIFKGFQGLEYFYIKFKDFPYFSRICTNPENNIIYDLTIFEACHATAMHSQGQFLSILKSTFQDYEGRHLQRLKLIVLMTSSLIK